MAFYLRKSLSFGPLRFNLSKSGVGVSAGIKGLRIGTGPRGNYIHAGRGGVYYRKTFTSRSAHVLTRELPPRSADLATGPDFEQPILSDADSTELINELVEKRHRVGSFPFCAVGSVAISALAIYFQITPAEIVALILALAIICCGCAVWDRRRKTTVLFYDIDSQVLKAFEDLHYEFGRAQNCSRVSHIDSTEHYSDRKYHAGVLQGVGRSNARPRTTSPPLVKTNAALVAMPAGKLTLYFCPDRVLVYNTAEIAAVAYSDLRLFVETCRFVEDEEVGADQQVVGRTWQYVNKSGGPDRRFTHNRQLPIVMYEQLRIKTIAGLDETFHFSMSGVATDLRNAIRSLARVLVLTKFWSELELQKPLPLSEQGTWCQYPHGNDLALQIASIRSHAFLDKLASLRASGESPSSAHGCNLVINSLIGTVLLDWKGLTDDHASPLPFTDYNAHEVLMQSVELLAFVTNKAVEFARTSGASATATVVRPQPATTQV